MSSESSSTSDKSAASNRSDPTPIRRTKTGHIFSDEICVDVSSPAELVRRRLRPKTEVEQRIEHLSRHGVNYFDIKNDFWVGHIGLTSTTSRV